MRGYGLTIDRNPSPGSHLAMQAGLQGELVRPASNDESNIPRYRPIRAEAGWPGTWKRLPVSVTVVPSTFRIEKSWFR